MNRKTTFFSLLLAFIVTGLHAESLTTLPRLLDGTEIQVDPSSHRIHGMTGDGTRYLLPDGVHRLENGNVVRVQKGIMLPDKILMEAKEPPPPPPVHADSCTQLERYSCGLRGQCGRGESCTLARQLKEYFNEADNFGRREVEQQCREALGNQELFKPCTTGGAALTSRGCRSLKAKVCGEKNQCASTQACDMVNQLLSMEQEEHLKSWSPSSDTWATRQCDNSLRDEAAFPACNQ